MIPSQNEDGLTGEQEARRLEKIRKSQRDYYLRNRDWLLEEARKKREEARKGRKRRYRRRKASSRAGKGKGASKGPPKEPQVVFTDPSEQAKWNDIGWVVAKMNKAAKMSQERIYELLGGLASKQEIVKWCAIGRELDRIESPN